MFLVLSFLIWIFSRIYSISHPQYSNFILISVHHGVLKLFKLHCFSTYFENFFKKIVFEKSQCSNEESMWY